MSPDLALDPFQSSHVHLNYTSDWMLQAVNETYVKELAEGSLQQLYRLGTLAVKTRQRIHGDYAITPAERSAHHVPLGIATGDLSLGGPELGCGALLGCGAKLGCGAELECGAELGLASLSTSFCLCRQPWCLGHDDVYCDEPHGNHGYPDSAHCGRRHSAASACSFCGRPQQLTMALRPAMATWNDCR